VPQLFRTEQKTALPPTVGGWTIVYTLKVVAGTAADVNFVSTGITYDSDYEYLVTSVDVVNPSPANTAPTVAVMQLNRADHVNYSGFYKPDGVTAVTPAGGGTSPMFAMVPSKQSPASLPAIKEFTGGGPKARIEIDTTGLFLVKWDADASNDGHWVIARRQRYG